MARRTTRRSAPQSTAAWRTLTHPFAPQSLFSEDRIEAIHATSLRVLQELGIKILLGEARDIFKIAGARVRAIGAKAGPAVAICGGGRVKHGRYASHP